MRAIPFKVICDSGGERIHIRNFAHAVSELIFGRDEIYLYWKVIVRGVSISQSVS